MSYSMRAHAMHADMSPPDSPEALTQPEQLLLGATRLWVRECADTAGALKAIQSYFGRFGAAAAARSHATLLRHSATAATRPIYINGLNCACLTQDEARIVHAVGHVQGGRADAAGELIAAWLQPAAIRLTLPAITGVAKAFSDRGLQVPVRHWRTARPEPEMDVGDAILAPTTGSLH